MCLKILNPIQFQIQGISSVTSTISINRFFFFFLSQYSQNFSVYASFILTKKGTVRHAETAHEPGKGLQAESSCSCCSYCVLCVVHKQGTCYNSLF